MESIVADSRSVKVEYIGSIDDDPQGIVGGQPGLCVLISESRSPSHSSQLARSLGWSIDIVKFCFYEG